jgi:hypothetical protein
MPAILTSACIRQYLATGCGQSEHVIQLAISQQSGIKGDRRAVEPEHQRRSKLSLSTPLSVSSAGSPMAAPLDLR